MAHFQVHGFLLIQNYDVIFVENFHLGSELVMMAKTSHFQGQMSLETGKPPILLIFVCYSSPSFLVFKNSYVIFAKIFHGRL
ncbi:hypothetical protein H5410_031953 [Solanum commersonii]|uniref:Uncharacterized protein n=1 Tax=Solanum commersonii TaxID=4109 RepID=A0A9J5YLH3_SOLCO|nr:hypothetical protein H5410_031953 [Solanum commersonii]